eukprot:COSAG01_NODE_6587_length_3590_cov_691.935853_4_plen_187_part_00
MCGHIHFHIAGRLDGGLMSSGAWLGGGRAMLWPRMQAIAQRTKAVRLAWTCPCTHSSKVSGSSTVTPSVWPATPSVCAGSPAGCGAGSGVLHVCNPIHKPQMSNEWRVGRRITPRLTSPWVRRGPSPPRPAARPVAAPSSSCASSTRCQQQAAGVPSGQPGRGQLGHIQHMCAPAAVVHGRARSGG